MLTAEELQTLRDDLAKIEAMLDISQAHYAAYSHLWTADEAWDFQAALDRQRFQLEMRKLTVQALSLTV